MLKCLNVSLRKSYNILRGQTNSEKFVMHSGV